MSNFIDFKSLEVADRFPGASAAYFQTAHSTIGYSELAAGTEIPLHSHPNEAVDIILDGILEMQIGNETKRLTTGMMSFVPGNMIHSAKAITDCKTVTLLHPKRVTGKIGK